MNRGQYIKSQFYTRKKSYFITKKRINYLAFFGTTFSQCSFCTWMTEGNGVHLPLVLSLCQSEQKIFNPEVPKITQIVAHFSPWRASGVFRFSLFVPAAVRLHCFDSGGMLTRSHKERHLLPNNNHG